MSATAVCTAAVIALAVLTAAVGIYAARLWHLASMMAVRSLYVDVGTIEPPGDEGAQATLWPDRMIFRAQMKQRTAQRRACTPYW